MNQEDIRLYCNLVEWILQQAEDQAATTKMFLGRIGNLEEAQAIRDDIAIGLEAGEDAAPLKARYSKLADVNQKASLKALTEPVLDALARAESRHDAAKALLAQLKKNFGV